MLGEYEELKVSLMKDLQNRCEKVTDYYSLIIYNQLTNHNTKYSYYHTKYELNDE